MAARQITAEGIAAGDRLNLAGAEFIVTARVHGAWYFDCRHARWVEFELIPTGGASQAPNARTVLRLPKDTLVTVDRSEADLVTVVRRSSAESASTRHLSSTSAGLVA